MPNLDLSAIKRSVIAYSVAVGVPEAQCQPLHIVEIVEHSVAWLAQHGIDPEFYRRTAHACIREMEIEAAHATALFPGVRELLLELRARGVATGIVTRNCAAALDIMFPDLADLCDAVRARDHVEFLKPDPRHLLHCLDALGCTPGESLMVGDGVLDMTAGKSLRMTCVGVLTGSNDASKLRAAGADHVLERATDLLTLAI